MEICTGKQDHKLAAYIRGKAFLFYALEFIIKDVLTVFRSAVYGGQSQLGFTDQFGLLRK